MKDKDLLKILLADGWELVSIKGSHHKIRKKWSDRNYSSPW
ncbi:MAG: type II toxin-antitoxin system HicA family toxin [Spirochaetaceae bacterium]|nr:type II toxin-antitoxin system HicA family toxin [Spirochaetaceae bacterium]